MAYDAVNPYAAGGRLPSQLIRVLSHLNAVIDLK
jgi:hypothetical protein